MYIYFLAGWVNGWLACWLGGSLNSGKKNYADGRIPVGYTDLRPYRYVLLICRCDRFGNIKLNAHCSHYYIPKYLCLSTTI